MSRQHIDDGVLHAWLDGALEPDTGAEDDVVAQHLAECAECRGRLEEARASKYAVSAMLSASDVPVPPPPAFATLESAAGSKDDDSASSTPEHSKRTSGWRRGPRVRLAWAATIAVAVSAGLLARELSDRRGIDLPATLEYEREAMQAELDEEPPRQKSEQRAEVAEEAREVPTEAPLSDADELAGRARLQATPSPALSASKSDATGCWSSIASTPAGVPTWLRLRENSGPAQPGAARIVEFESDSGVVLPPTASWEPLGADSLLLSFPGFEVRLRVEVDRLAGIYRVTTGVNAKKGAASGSELSFERVPCPGP